MIGYKNEYKIDSIPQLPRQFRYASANIGVDIEYCHRDVSNLWVHVLSSEECAQGIWSNRNFIDLWVIKESILKALGFGISEYLPAITVLPNNDGSYRVMHDQRDWTEIKAWTIEAPAHYAAAFALTNQRNYLVGN
ncbi:4'-phosphopantetheinyl transferase superfamily protein [Nitrosomonas ureae]|uniref:4'-phosphopantetheinyl transferase n=1 Tax=Nitrosomonas ureae TaxID=44577 RepID=A0A1H5UR99_9PROT|nr:4'-phosphopantetheinyl transferase superfamily protein [Nitrosomonas ureae]SEF77632.1 4'-phosphopantetheinyl transferase [Nitrosomonas ureae]